MKIGSDKRFEELRNSTKIGILDKIFNRSVDEKARNMYHFLCLKEMGTNAKRDGRWGFRPVLGATEFFSTVFSFLQLVMNVICFHVMLKKHLNVTIIWNLYYIQYYVLNTALISSTLFHIHENVFTRNCDYFFSFLTILFELYLALVRVFMIVPKFGDIIRQPLRVMFISFCIYHVHRVYGIEFDYNYNKIYCVAIIALTFLSHFLIFLRYRNMPHAKHILLFIMFFFIAGVIETRDFPPYAYIIDSHALWHLILCVSTPFYFSFLTGDIHTH